MAIKKSELYSLPWASCDVLCGEIQRSNTINKYKRVPYVVYNMAKNHAEELIPKVRIKTPLSYSNNSFKKFNTINKTPNFTFQGVKLGVVFLIH